VSTTLNGLASIRAYGAQSSFEHQFHAYLNDHSATWFLYVASSKAMGLYVDYIATAYLVIITFSVMLTNGIEID